MTFASLLAVLVLAGVFFFMAWYFSVLHPRAGTLDWVALQENKPLTFAVPRHPMTRKDALPLLLITAVYAFTAFFSLGSTVAPDYRQAWDLSDGVSYTVELSGQPVYVSKLWHYSQLGTGGYNLSISEDGKHWSTLWTRTEKDQWGRDQTVWYWAMAEDYEPSYALPQTYNHVFKWTETVPENPQYVKYLRISGRGDKDVLQLGKLIFFDHHNEPLALSWTMADGSEAPEELRYALAADGTVPGRISWRNSGYFDEIYHPRTALEHVEGVYPYEITHPPLGKLLLSVGIRLFGMTPFGWRFMGTLFGVGMVPLFYLFLKNLFGKTPLAACGTVLFAGEFMHLTQTRIATIDTYGVFFVLLSYLFFYRWLTASATPDKKGATHEGWSQLILSGAFWGVGCACKWTVIYAGAGLALLYLIHMIRRVRLWEQAEGGSQVKLWVCKTLAVSVLCYVLIPAAIYTLSYIPYAQAAGHLSLSGVIDEMWRNQSYMLHYHNGVHAPHPYSSRWYQWLVDARPILYYSKDLGDGLTEKFAAFTNPLNTWLGFFAILTCMAKCFRKIYAKLILLYAAGLGCALICWLVGRVENGDFDPALTPEELRARFVVMGICLLLYLAAATLIAFQTAQRRSGLAIFLTVGFAAQFLPWVTIGRTTFAYHYFPSTLFLILAICALFNDLMECQRAKWQGPVYAVTACSAGLYLLFYPYLTGLPMKVSYFNNFLRFLPSWP